MRFLVLTSLALLLLAVSPWAPAAPHFKDGEGKACKVRVEGEGYLRFVRDGRVVYAKEAALQAIDGKLCHSEGAPVIPTISVAAPFMVNLEGNVVAGGKSVGRLVLAHFPASASLRPDGPFLVAAERPRLAEPGEGDSGVIRSVGVATPGVTPAPTSPPTTGTARGIRISVAPSTEVGSQAVRLGDIATIEGDPAEAAKLRLVEVGAALKAGLPLTIERDRLMAKLRAAGFRPENFVILVPERAKVTLKGREVTGENFLAAAAAFLREKGITGELKPAGSLPSYEVAGEFQLVPEAHSSKLNEHQVQIAIVVDGRRVASRTVRLAGPALIEGVKAGQIVTILMKSGGATVEVKGKAKKSAFVGEQVEVTSDKDTRHIGMVTQPGVVEVKI